MTKELLEVTSGDVTLLFLVDQFEEVRLAELLSSLEGLHSLDHAIDHGFLESLRLESLPLKHELEFFVLNHTVFVSVHLVDEHFDIVDR